MVRNYIPKRGDIIFMDFVPIIGHEQNGKIPVIVVSQDIFNEHTKMIYACPISSNTKDFPTHYILEDTKKISGAVLCEYLRSFDYESRKVKYIEHVSDRDLISVITLCQACID